MSTTDTPATDVGAAADPAAAPRSRRLSISDGALQTLLLFGFLVAIAAYFTSQDPDFLTTRNGLNILVNASVIGIVSLGQLLALISGGFDLSVGGIVPLGAVSFALLVNAGYGVATAVLLVLLLGAAAGVVNGLLIARARINPLIATLGTLSVAGGLALTLADGVQVPFDDVSDGVLTQRSLFDINNHVWIFLGLSLLLFVVLRYTSYGRQLYAVGGNKQAARLAGIRVDLVTISVYVVSGALAALAGAVLASQLLTGSGTAGTGSGLQSITAVILGGASLSGGVGGVPGTLIGVLILGALSNGMAILTVPSFFQTMATGAVLLLAVGISQYRSSRRAAS
ncbi:ABC transporter permease [Geodermatophilus sp. CPCC 206100]|uniref:ABC transporter permease n=1 Tax=Geodermatophilus sp. CPCC 206100 TaxID=3020054 RepID=UPI003AFFB6BE